MLDLWLDGKLGDFISLQRGYDLPAQDRKSGRVPVMGGGGPNGYHSEAKANGPGVLLGRSGAGFGKAWWCESDFWPHNTALFVSDFKGNFPEFVFYFLDYSDFETYNSGGAQPSLNRNFIYPIEVRFPPLPEQRKIAEILRTWDEAIDACERLIEQKQMRVDGLRQRLFLPTRPGEAPEVADTWDETSLGEIFTENSRSNPGLGPDDVITVGKYAIRKQVEHFTRSVASANLSNYQFLEPGDFVYDPMSAYYGAIGRYAGEQPGIVSPAYRVIQLREGINPEFAEALLKSHYIAFELENRSSQGNREGKRRTLRRDEFGSVPLMLPPIDKQDYIAKVIGEFRRDFQLTQQSKDALAEQKRGLMQKLLTGEWRVAVEEDLP